MKLIKNLLKQKLGVTFGLVVGVMLMGGVSKGLDQYNSTGVSYTKSDGTVVSVKDALDELITKSSKVDTLEKQVADYKKVIFNLYDKVAVGDYVAYDAGTWDSSVPDKPIEQGKFGGYSQGQSKNSSVEWCWKSDYKTTLNGWRVLKKDGGKVYLVHAGQPECYYHAGSRYIDASEKALNERAQSTYLNTTYADSAHAMNYQEAYDIDKTEPMVATNNDLQKTGDYYYLAADFTGSIWSVENDGSMWSNNIASRGFRPVIVLKASVQTTGKVHDEFGQEAWNLILPPQ